MAIVIIVYEMPDRDEALQLRRLLASASEHSTPKGSGEAVSGQST